MAAAVRGRIRETPRGLHGNFGPAGHGPQCVLVEDLARRGQAEFAGRTLEKAHPERPLKLSILGGLDRVSPNVSVTIEFRRAATIALVWLLIWRYHVQPEKFVMPPGMDRHTRAVRYYRSSRVCQMRRM